MRQDIYYWKCDRPTSFHGLRTGAEEQSADLRPALAELLSPRFGDCLELTPLSNAGNHRTFRLKHRAGLGFVRVEDGPEADRHLEIETRIIEAVGRTGVPVSKVLFTDASRAKHPFAVQVLDYLGVPSLHSFHLKEGLNLPVIARQIGRSVAQWQAVPVVDFGHFRHSSDAVLRGTHAGYETYFTLNLERHLSVLTRHRFLSKEEAAGVLREVERCRKLLDLPSPCLVHKDLALWNIMGEQESIAAFIDWDDAIAGDPCDDLSLVACFHSPETVREVVAGYGEIRELPGDFDARFHLHLLRNLIVKALIRCEAGYFDLGRDQHFLFAPGQDGAALRQFTRERFESACRGLALGRPYHEL